MCFPVKFAKFLRTTFLQNTSNGCFCTDFFAHVGKRLDKKAKVNFKIYDVTDWIKNNYNTHIVQYLTK